MLRHQMPDGTYIAAPTYKEAKDQYTATRLAQNAPAVRPPAPVLLAPVKVFGTATPDDNFAGRNNDSFLRVGVGEQINLNFITAPPGTTAVALGGLRWSIRTGVGLLANQNGDTGIAVLTCGSTPGILRLELKTPANVLMATKTLDVVAPQNGRMVILPGTEKHTQGMAGAGFEAEIYLDPRDVSFKRIEVREGSCISKATGSFAGLWTTKVGDINNLAFHTDTISGFRHPVMGDWIGVLGGNSATGCKLDGIDQVESGNLRGPHFTPGSFTWDIAWFYRTVDSSEEFEFAKAQHLATVTANGQMTMTKLGATLVKQLNDPTVP